MLEGTAESGPGRPKHSGAMNPSSLRPAQHSSSEAADAGSTVKTHQAGRSPVHDQGSGENDRGGLEAPVRASLPLLKGARGAAKALTPVSEWAPLRGRFNSAIPRPTGAATQSATSSCLRGTEGRAEAEAQHTRPPPMDEAPVVMLHGTALNSSAAAHHLTGPASGQSWPQATSFRKSHPSMGGTLPGDTDRQALSRMPSGPVQGPQAEQQVVHPATIRDAWRMQRGVPRQGGLVGRGLLHGRDPMSPCPMQDVRLSQALPRGVRAQKPRGASRRRSSGLGMAGSRSQQHVVQPPWVGPTEGDEAEGARALADNSRPQGIPAIMDSKRKIITTCRH